MSTLLQSWWVRFGLYLLGSGLWLGALFHGMLNTPQWSSYLLTHPAALFLYNVVSQGVVEAVPVLLAWLLLVRPDRLTVVNAGRSLPGVTLGVAVVFVIGAPLAGWLAGVPQTGGWITWLIPGFTALAVALGEEYTARFAVWSSLSRKVGILWGAVGTTLYFILSHGFELWRNYLSYANHAIWPTVGAPVLEGLVPFGVVAVWVVWRSGSLIPAIGAHWVADWVPWRTGLPAITITGELVPLVLGVVAAEVMVRTSRWGRHRHSATGLAYPIPAHKE